MADKTNRWPLLAQVNQRYGALGPDANLLNGFVEMDTQQKLENQQPQVWVYKRGGFTVYQAAPSTPGIGQGIFWWQGNVYTIVAGQLYKQGVVLGTAGDSTQPYQFTACLGATNRIIYHNTVKLYYSNGTTTNNVAYPTAMKTPVPGLAYLDGTIYIMDTTGQIFGSGINDPTTWNALNVLVAQIEPDSGVYITKQLVYVVAMKQYSIEVFYDAGNATGSPLAPVQGAKVNFGCANANSVQEVMGVLYFIARMQSGGYFVASLNNLKPTIISTPNVVRLLNTDGLGTVFSWSGQHQGHNVYGITLQTSGISIVYDIDQQIWYQWAEGTSNTWLPWIGSTGTSAGMSITQDINTGAVMNVSSAVWQDDVYGVFNFTLTTPDLDMNTRMNKQMDRLEVVGDRKLGGLLTVNCSDDDYQTWDELGQVDLSTEHPMIVDCGTFSTRALQVTQQTSDPLRLRALEYLADQGSL